MAQIPDLTDRTALARNRKRSVAGGMFLHHQVVDEIKDRLTLVNRSFTGPAIITGFPELWSDLPAGTRVIEDQDILDLSPGSHDLAIHVMGLHWATDPVGQLIQMRRALKPDGLMLGACFGGQTLYELRAALAEAESRITGGLSPRVAPMADIRDMGNLLQRAGFALPVLDSVTTTVTYADAFSLMRDLRAMGEANALTGRLRHMTRRSVLTEAAKIYRASFGRDDGRIPATFEVIHLQGWAPDPTQPQPLRPGSAKVRLADALGTTETKLSD